MSTNIVTHRRIGAPRETVDAQSWAWTVDIREHHPSKKVYSVNPFAEVYSFHENVYSILTESPGNGGEVWMHLIIGNARALLIDTGFGIGNIKGLVDEIIGDLPLLVANTHPHGDHASGNCQFDKVYVYETAIPYLTQDPHRWDRMLDGSDSSQQGLTVLPEDIPPFKTYQVVGVSNGFCFNLGGGHEVEVVFMPGHSAGGCCFLDKKNRILFGGDAFISMRMSVGGPRGESDPYPQYTTIRALQIELEKLANRTGEFDFIYSGHFTLGMKSEVVNGLLHACKQVLSDPDCYDYKQEKVLGGIKRMTLFKYVPILHDLYGEGVLAYNEKSIG